MFFAVSPSYSAFFELALSTYYVVGALGNEWVFPTREGYLRNMSAITKLVSDTKQANKTFYRTERLEAQTGNDSMKFNYNGISQFSSIRMRLYCWPIILLDVNIESVFHDIYPQGDLFTV